MSEKNSSNEKSSDSKIANDRQVHFVGIKGVGMTALALYVKELGFSVTGSDTSENFVTEEILKNSNIPIKEFSAENINDDLSLIIVSAAYSKNHIEIKEARKKHIEIKWYSEALASYVKDSRLIAVAGIHGKTTTASLITYLLNCANLDPSYIIGAGKINALPTTGHKGQGEFFIVEADEYRKSPDDNTAKFLDLSPEIEIITSIELDHPDIYFTEEEIYNVFYKFACRIPRNGFIVICADYPKAKKLQRSLADRNIESYGFSEEANWKIFEFTENIDFCSFKLTNKDQNYGPFYIKIPGKANVLNATSAIITCLKLGLENKFIIKYLKDFAGVKRRYEIVGQFGNNIIIDDYAHHPHAISLLVESIKNKYPDYKIWCVFQPHTFSRTKRLLDEFSKSFKDADRVIITDIYASAREGEADITGLDLANKIKENQKNVKFIPTQDKIVQDIIDSIGESNKNIILTIGAGDIYLLGQRLLEKIKNSEK